MKEKVEEGGCYGPSSFLCLKRKNDKSSAKELHPSKRFRELSYRKKSLKVGKEDGGPFEQGRG